MLLVAGVAIAQTHPAGGALDGRRSRVLVSSDIGGDDPDDFQSLVHLLVYADRLDIEGLVSSPPGAGRKADILKVLDAYAADYPRLKTHASAFPTPDILREVTRQGAIDAAPAKGYAEPTEGSKWIIHCAGRADARPLYVLVWGSITDVAQAVHDAPRIKPRIRIYSIGSWNTRQDPHARRYLFEAHPDLWWIEADTTFRGMYVGGNQDAHWGNRAFIEQHVRGHGALGDFFWSRKRDLKMGDTPSVLYMLAGDPDHPTGEHWGGQFQPMTGRTTCWTDLDTPELRTGAYNGAVTVNRWRTDFLGDWQQRMDWTLAPSSQPSPASAPAQ